MALQVEYQSSVYVKEDNRRPRPKTIAGYGDLEEGLGEDVVMTASKRGIESVIRIERIAKNEVNYNDVYHVGGGPLKGIIINRAKKDLQNLGNAQIRMCFTVSLKNKKAHGGRTKEDRELLFWFKPGVDRISQQRYAREYFDMLISPEDFPRDYTNFIKKAIVLTKSFPDMRSLEVVMKPPVSVTVDETDRSYVETTEEKIIVHSPPPLEVAPALNASFDEDNEREERIARAKREENRTEELRKQKAQGEEGNFGFEAGVMTKDGEGKMMTQEQRQKLASLDPGSKSVQLDSKVDEFGKGKYEGEMKGADDEGRMMTQEQRQKMASLDTDSKSVQLDSKGDEFGKGKYEGEMKGTDDAAMIRMKQDQGKDGDKDTQGLKGQSEDEKNKAEAAKMDKDEQNKKDKDGAADKAGDEGKAAAYEFSDEEDDDADNEDRTENFITVLTPALYDYQYMPEVPVSNKTWISFRVRGKADAHIALSSVYGDTERKTYEIVIGGWNNTRSVIRDGGQAAIVTDAVTLNILSGYEFRSFWVSWDRGVVRVGEGTRRNHQPFLVWNVPENKQHGVNCIAVSSGPGSEGEWEFIEYIVPLKAEEQTKSARKAKIRMSLLWLAKKQKMLQVLEDCYPNSMGTADLLRLSNIKLHDMMTAIVFLRDLQNRGLITEVTKGIWMRAPGGKNDKAHVVKVVNEMPALPMRDSPTVAVVSAMYCEKLAVDAMMETKTSYINYKQGGESQVYTIGRIGNHQVVSTKLSRIGASRQAALNAGHSAEIMLATFNQVEHVFLVGCGGAVPNYMDYDRHVRLGDIVVTSVGSAKGSHEYLHCEKIEQSGQDTYDYENAWWRCRNPNMVAALEQMRSLNNSGAGLVRPWERFVTQGLETLHAEESSFHRPAMKTDRLYAEIDGRMVQVEHPKPPLGQNLELDNKPRVRYGPVASGRYVARNQRMRMDFARKYGVVAYSQEFDAVMETLEKNNKDSFLVIRGISDYVDGSKLKDWQPYASLVAASFTKAIITALPSSRRFGYY